MMMQDTKQNAPIRVISLGKTDAVMTQAVYHAVAAAMTQDTPDTIILTQPATPYLCIGYHQALEQILDLEICKAKQISIVRRKLGGGTTYLDENQIFYQCVFHQSRLPARFEKIYAKLLSPPIEVLKNMGLDASLQGANEIEVSGKRIAGTGGGQLGEAAVVVGNILLDFDMSAMTTVWFAPSHGFRRLAENALSERLTTLKQLGIDASPSELCEKLTNAYSQSLGRPIAIGSLTSEEQAKAEAFCQTLASDEFLALHEPEKKYRPLKISARAFIHHETLEIDGMSFSVAMKVTDGIISDAVIECPKKRFHRKLHQFLIGKPLKNWQSELLLQEKEVLCNEEA
ncbi:biotin/lipoate A/B protein ligase [Chloroherpeton thalassium ATCC 35110]|uniref:Biotin/lipoate A/B protein ligase n=1 Tax=Chloroherpeton thalassium (strain ATCC 35110 / GB-78) TaxID=517418 RepID=B3QSV3_CHLT3|nr:biotin/lipoate A/B protein ligase family protein [Chloroherpeton thalassium]ACF12596.1 biotin/lipoate A/B protein ligase [Chloroherpeton thalassium ATCC 35110]